MTDQEKREEMERLIMRIQEPRLNQQREARMRMIRGFAFVVSWTIAVACIVWVLTLLAMVLR